MNNAELNTAIITIASLIQRTAKNDDMFVKLNDHLEALLVVQLNRALPAELNITSLTDAANLSGPGPKQPVKVQRSKDSYAGPVPA